MQYFDMYVCIISTKAGWDSKPKMADPKDELQRAQNIGVHRNQLRIVLL